MEGTCTHSSKGDQSSSIHQKENECQQSVLGPTRPAAAQVEFFHNHVISASPDNFSYITSFDVWSALQGIFNANSKTRILQVRNPLNMFKKEERSVKDYVSELTQLAKEVQEVSVALDDEELTLIAPNGLDLSYDAFIMVHIARFDDIPFTTFQRLS